MSSHREAPEISKDPVADSTDVYAFVSPDQPDTVTLIANYIPLQSPGRRAELLRVRRRRPLRDPHLQQGSRPRPTSPTSSSSTPRSGTRRQLPLQHRPDRHASTTRNWNRPQFYSVTRVRRTGSSKVLAKDLSVPAGQRRAAQHAELRRAGGGRRCTRLSGGRQGLRRPACRRLPRRPRQRLRPRRAAAVQRRAPDLDAGHGRQSTRCRGSTCTPSPSRCRSAGPDQGRQMPTARRRRKSVIGVWATASRRKSRIWDRATGKYVGHGPWEQVSRLGNPLFNEVIVPMAEKDVWNARPPSEDARFAKYVDQPGAGRAAAGALPGRVPEPGGVRQAARRPQRDPAHRHPGGGRPRVPELHRDGGGGHAPAQHGDPAVGRPRTRSVWWPATPPASRTGAGSATTS